MVQMNVGSEILCDRVYFILYNESNATAVEQTLHLPFALTLETDLTFRVKRHEDCNDESYLQIMYEYTMRNFRVVYHIQPTVNVTR